jgi:hypothetical protein
MDSGAAKGTATNQNDGNHSRTRGTEPPIGARRIKPPATTNTEAIRHVMTQVVIIPFMWSA